DDARHGLGQGGFAGAVFADKRVDFAAAQREIDALDCRHAGVELGGFPELDDVFSHFASASFAAVSCSRSNRRDPLASTYSAPSSSATAVTPWFSPSTRLWKENSGEKSDASRITSP